MKLQAGIWILSFLLGASASLPALGDGPVIEPVRPEQVPSGIDYKVSQPPVEDPHLFAGKRVAILASNGVEESELTFPYEYLTQRGAQVEILVPSWTAEGIVASRYLKPTLFVHATHTFKAALATQYDLLVLTGGAWNAQVVRTDGDALNLIRHHFEASRPIAAICAGSAILINTGIAKDSDLTGSPAVRVDLENAGARYIDKPAVRFQMLLTSRTPDDLPAFVEGIRTLLLGR